MFYNILASVNLILCYDFNGQECVLTLLLYRLEKRRQAMLEMPQMIQTWKEVSLTHDLETIRTILTRDFREDTVVAGRNGRNSRCHDEWWTRFQRWSGTRVCTFIALGTIAWQKALRHYCKCIPTLLESVRLGQFKDYGFSRYIPLSFPYYLIISNPVSSLECTKVSIYFPEVIPRPIFSLTRILRNLSRTWMPLRLLSRMSHDAAEGQ